MIVLSYGMTKSGSTLAFELCKSVLEKKGYPQRRLSDDIVVPGHHINFMDDVTVAGLKRVMEAVDPKEIIVVKLHTVLRQPEVEFVQSQVAGGAMAVQVNFRDPREICLSLVDAGARAREKQRPAFSEITNLNDAAKTVVRQLNVCRRWGSIRGTLHLFYNDVAFDTASTVKRMCQHLGVEMLDDADCRAAIDVVFNEAFTQRNKAVKDRYKDDLTVRQNEDLLEQFPSFRTFIRKVCEQADYSWFSLVRESADVDAA